MLRCQDKWVYLIWWVVLYPKSPRPQGALSSSNDIELESFTEELEYSVKHSLISFKNKINKQIIDDVHFRLINLPCFMKSNKKIKKIGRNDPCLCGSGKKYKKCCFQN